MSSGATNDNAYPGFARLTTALAVLTALFYWSARSHVSELDRVTVGSACAAAELCYLVAMATHRWKPASAAIAVGMAIPAAIIFFGGATLWGAWQRAWGNDGAQPFQAIYFISLLVCIAFVGAALLHARAGRGAFVRGAFLGFGIMIVGGSVASSILGAKLETFQQARTDSRMRELRASNLVLELTACALQQRFADSAGAFPESLEAIRTGRDCTGAPLSSSSLDGYTLTYVAHRALGDTAITDFQITATPAVAAEYVASVVSDGRGLVFIIHEPPPSTGRSDTGAYIIHRGSGLAFVQGYRRTIRGYIDRQSPPVAPQSLEELFSDSTSDEARYIRLVSRDTIYRVDYVPPSSPQSREFGVSSQCLRYGTECLRSYYLGPDDVIHATGEPRAARATDPPIADSEDSNRALKPGTVGWRGR